MYTFVPWLRRGAAKAITWDDNPADTTHVGRATATAELVLGYTPVAGGPTANPAAPPTASRSIELVGPGDIRSLKPETVLRMYPDPGSPNATPGELAYVEFYEEDLPWRYTPARPAYQTVAGQARPRLRPWLALFVLRDGEFDTRQRTAQTPVLTIHGGVELPPAEESWAWAHAQLAGQATAADAGQRIAASPNTALSRLLCPRRLVGGVLYTAFLVPAFDTGRLAGLDQPWASVPALRPSWGAAVSSRDFPVYHSWSFTTGTDGSFESAARGLTARPVGAAFGKRPVRVAPPGFGLAPSALPSTLELEGALVPPNFPRASYPDQAPGTAAAQALQQVVDHGTGLLEPGGSPLDPGIAPPAYGLWHADVNRLSDVDDSGEVGWVREVNLDLRQRAVAGLGAAIVRARQDDFVQRAWRQVGELRDANQRRREGELAVAAAEVMFGKHLASADTDQALSLTAPAHHAIAAPPTVVYGGQSYPAGVAVPSLRAVLRDSTLPTAALDAAFARLTRPSTALVAQATNGTVSATLLNGTLLAGLAHGTVSAAPPLAEPAAAISASAVAHLLSSELVAANKAMATPAVVFWQLLVQVLTAALPGPINATTLPSVSNLQTLLAAALRQWVAQHPNTKVESRVEALIKAIKALRPDGSSGVVVVIDQPAFVKEFGSKSAGVNGRGVTVTCPDPPSGGLAAIDDPDELTAYLKAFEQLVRAVRPSVEPVRPPDLDALATAAIEGVRPSEVLVGRILAALPGLPEPAGSRRLRPVLAYPVFNDAMVEALRALDPAYILPNIGDLAADTLTLMQPNHRFIEALFAGLNTEMARELLWREYPTDQRGSYFRVFWSHADADSEADIADVEPLHTWQGRLGGNGTLAGTPIVLVMRTELLRKFPRTLVYAQRAHVVNGRRTLDLDAPPVYPVFQANVDPDVAMFGFELPGDPRGRSASGTDPGDPGMYFVLKERAGQIRFGLDADAPTEGFGDWDDLWWGQVPNSAEYLRLGTPGSLTPTDPGGAVWAATAADMASILIRGQVMYARHAVDMLI